MLRDDKDLRILSILTADGRVTKAALADQVGLSATACWERLRKLEKAGLIESYGARVNLAKLGPSVSVFAVVELYDHTAASFQTFETAMARFDEITGCWALGGGYDYLLHVTTKEISAYQDLIDQMLEARIGLKRYYTYIVTKTIKEPGRLPMNLLSMLATGR